MVSGFAADEVAKEGWMCMGNMELLQQAAPHNTDEHWPSVTHGRR